MALGLTCQLILPRSPNILNGQTVLEKNGTASLNSVAFDAHAGTIKSGSTFSKLFQEHGIDPKQAPAFYHEFRKLQGAAFIAGDSFVIQQQKETLIKIFIRSAQREWYCVERRDDSIAGWVQKPNLRVVEARVAGILADNLYNSIVGQGENAELVSQFADVFAWDINFFIDPRQGDSFVMVVEKYFEGDEFVKYGRILAAQYKSTQRSFGAFLFAVDGEAPHYYDAEGRSLQKMFLKAPLHYTRISSRFSLRRFHPVLRLYRRHLAVDYAAPAGTPVYAAADGVVEYAERHGGYGKTICIRHKGGYKTYYGHLTEYAEGVRPGKNVGQYECVGTVGSTGLATGSHLDYRVERNGRYIDPLSVESPRTQSVPPKERMAFESRKLRYLARLDARGAATVFAYQNADHAVESFPFLQ